MEILLFASSALAPSVMLPSYEVCLELRANGSKLISGFQSLLETDCLDILLKGSQPLTICPARHFDPLTDRLYSGVRWQEVKKGVEEGRVSILSPPNMVGKRITKENAAKRNEFLVEQADSVLLLYATPGGETERVVKLALARGLPVSVLDHPANTRWLDLHCGKNVITGHTPRFHAVAG